MLTAWVSLRLWDLNSSTLTEDTHLLDQDSQHWIFANCREHWQYNDAMCRCRQLVVRRWTKSSRRTNILSCRGCLVSCSSISCVRSLQMLATRGKCWLCAVDLVLQQWRDRTCTVVEQRQCLGMPTKLSLGLKIAAHPEICKMQQNAFVLLTLSCRTFPCWLHHLLWKHFCVIVRVTS